MTAYYNDNSREAAAWLEVLISEGQIAPGHVDCRPIQEVTADDLRGYTQCHFFAGIGVWSYALRLAGWPDDRPVWTGSCPCQPFSEAGKGLGFADPRHLWPTFRRLIVLGRPHVCFGEQVAAANDWLALVRANLESDGYAFGYADLAAAGFEAAHRRQRFSWVADANNAEWWADHAPRDDSDGPQAGRIESYCDARTRLSALRLADASGCRQPGDSERDGRAVARTGAPPRWLDDDGCDPLGRLGEPSRAGLSDADFGIQRRQGWWPQRRASGEPSCPPGPSVDWLLCRDGRFRPVEPGSCPLVTEAPARMATLRGYGNAMDAVAQAAFVRAYLEAELGL